MDPFGDLHAVSDRGRFTGNRGCLVDELGRTVRHHRGQLWIVCVTAFKDWRSPLAQPGHWTPLFFLDDATALAAGHRPCGLCRRDDYRSYREAVQHGLGLDRELTAADLNRMLAKERLERGRGLDRATDRKTWVADSAELPDGTVVVDADQGALLVRGDTLYAFGFGGWRESGPRPASARMRVLTPPTSVLALEHGYQPVLDVTAFG